MKACLEGHRPKKTLFLLHLCGLALITSGCVASLPSPTAPATLPLPTVVPTVPWPAAPPTVSQLPQPVVTSTPSSEPAEPLVCQISGPEVYLAFAGERHHIVDWETFLNLGFRQDQIRPCGVSAAYPAGAPLTRLLKGSGDPVYWMENGRRRHIPDMETFRALGLHEQDITVVADDLLALWPAGAPMPAQTALPPAPASPTRQPASSPTVQAATTLQGALKAIHDQFQIDPSRGCFELLSPYPDYHRGLQRMTALLLTDPRAQALTFAEREALFKDVTGFDGVRFFPGEAAATLVLLRTNRGHNLGCGSHYASPDALHVVDQRGAIYDIGTGGIDTQVWWIADRWVALFRTKLDSSSGPTPWIVWHIGKTGDGWGRVLEYAFTPMPYDFTPPPVRFESGYQALIADLQYWWADDPCEFTPAFKETYKHDTWQMRRTYRLAGDTYALASSQVLTFTVQRQDTGETVALNWQDYCAGPIR